MRKRGYLGKFPSVDIGRIGQIPLIANEKFLRPSTISLKRRIFSIAFLSIVGIFFYLSLTISQAGHNAATLREIRDVRYPVQANLLNALHKLEIMQRELEASVFTGDHDLVVSTALLAEEFRQKMRLAAVIDPVISVSITSIMEKFDVFFLGSSSLAMDMTHSKSHFNQYSARAGSISESYNSVVNELQKLLNTQTYGLSQSIAKANREYGLSMLVGYVSGITGIVLVVFLAWFTAHGIVKRINEMVTSLRNIARGESDMSVRIQLQGKDEMTELAFWFNAFIARLEAITNQSTNEIRRTAYIDNLSGLPNRRMLIECMSAEEERCITNPQRRTIGMFLDLDNFKPINDQLGHDAGDELIRQVAERLIKIFGKSISEYIDLFKDMGEGNLPIVARLGGDEFFVMVQNVADDNYAEQLAKTILEVILQPYIISGQSCHIGVSIGIGIRQGNPANSTSLIDEADMAMYEAKNSGKNTYRFYTDKLVQAVQYKAKLENALRQSIEKEELQLLFQPQFDLDSGHYRGAEVLLRWCSEEFGLLTPNQFFDSCEKNGQILKLDSWVINETFNQLGHWIAHGNDPGRIAINVSLHLMRDRNGSDIIKSCMAEHKISTSQIELEVTASSVMAYFDEVGENLRILSEGNIQIALDNFGVGQSSMQLLLGSNIDVLKLDRALIEKLEKDNRTQIVVSSLISMAKSLGITTIAEGIETESQLLILKDLGCDIGQGYFFAKPMSSDKLQEYMGSIVGETVLRVS